MKKNTTLLGTTSVLLCTCLLVNSFPVSLMLSFHSRNDTTPPQIIINFAGNLTDKGGPAYRIHDFNHTLPNGYYTNDSYQHEHWIYINVTVNGTGSDPDTVLLHWCQRSTSSILWDNTSWSFVRTGWTGKPYEYYYEFNSSGNITISENECWYSFDVWAHDQAGLSILESWEKDGLGYSVTRRYVQLGCTPRSIEYVPFYVWDHTQDSGVYDGVGDYGKPDDLHHDQGAAFNSNDTGYINSTLPGDELQFRRCGGFVGLWFEDSVCIQPFELRNIYFHFWWSTQDGELEKLGWKKNRMIPLTIFNDYFATDVSQSCSDLFVDNHDAAYNDSYQLTAALLPVRNTLDHRFTDNDIYELCIQLVAYVNAYPNVIDNRSILSFVLFNVPDNQTLSIRDSDNDLLDDYTELYETFTSPFVSDTDNDGWTDYEEYQVRTDPNNYLERLPKVDTLSALDVSSGSSCLRGLLCDDEGSTCEIRFTYSVCECPDLSTFIRMDQAGAIAWSYGSDWHGSYHSNDVFEELVTGLESNTVYVFRAGARNQNGEHWGGYQVFTTE